MTLSNLKARAMQEAMKFMQSNKGQKVMANPDVQKAMQWAFQTSFKMQNKISGAKKSLAKKLAVANEDDLKELKRSMDRLERKVKRMNETAKKKAAAAKKSS